MWPSAKATLAASVANYINVVGHKPGNLKYPKLAKLPKTLDEAQAAAEEINPNILAAAYVEEASNYDTEVVKGDLLPSVDLGASAQYNDNPTDGVGSSESARIEGVLTIPLYEAGRVYSSVRRSQAGGQPAPPGSHSGRPCGARECFNLVEQS